MARRALLCGCNYPGSNAELRGCINDCMAMRALLTEHFGFQDSGITMMLDTDPSTTKPTGANIKAKLGELVAASQPGDVLFFHFSGHGTQVPDDGESDGYDEAICPADIYNEAICPADMNVITDDDLRAVFKPLRPGVKLTVVADCCHSGTLLDHSAIAISGPKAGEKVPDFGSLIGSMLIQQLAGRGVEAGGAGEGGATRDVRNRSLPTNQFLQMLSGMLGQNVSKGNIRSSLVSLFGNASSAKAINYSQMAKQASTVMAAAQKGDYSGCLPLLGALFAACLGGAAAAGGGQPGGPAPGEPALNVNRPPGSGGGREEKLGDDVGILITGCQSHETSADACPSGDPKQAYGALSNGIRTVITAHAQQNPGQTISYRTLVTGVRQALAQARFSQNPCLECSEENADTPFILP
ncbi:metacaspase type II [Chlorella sorokiniana]|uniref:Metacaspase type II n=1 Tax=Chlorella sorokiniana TaxID=3076 RepID=A0A2P6TH54_CHLSO|nr:metacaspase type II [Chlorella sorokiniana]|eukprot:PRW33622.1 metacaspase type II [Chlorella sorokiniana]